MNEEVSNKSVNLAVSTSKVTARTLYRALIEYSRRQSNKTARQSKQTYIYKGKQTLKQLIGQNQGVSSMEIGDSDVRTFKRIAKKHGVDFAITKDNSEEKPKYLVFFKARDADAIRKVLQDYSDKVVKHSKEIKKESVLEKLKKFKGIAKLTPKKEKKREHIR